MKQPITKNLSRSHLWKLWLQWILASGIGWFVGAASGFAIAIPFARHYYWESLKEFGMPTVRDGFGAMAFILGGTVFMAVFVVVSSSVQWLVFRRRASETIYWVLASSFGAILGAILGAIFGLPLDLIVMSILGAILGVIFGLPLDLIVMLLIPLMLFGAVLGLIQWSAIERKGSFSRSVGVWIVASSFGWALAGLLAFKLSGLAEILYKVPVDFHILHMIHTITISFSGLIYGAITGKPLTQLLWQASLKRNPEKPSDSQ
jgi:uncharacterized protein YacL